MVNRVIRDDPSKGTMHNREPITPKLLWKSLRDYDLWPIYALGLCFQTPLTTPKQYLTLTLKGLGFNTFMTNLLIIPSEALSIIFILILTYTSEITGELTLISMIGQIWALPFVLCLYILDINTMNKWSAWALMTLLLSYPNGMLTHHFPIIIHLAPLLTISQHMLFKLVGILAIPTLFVRARCLRPCTTCVSSPRALSRPISIVKVGNFPLLNCLHVLTRTDDAPRYRRGNRVLIGLVVSNIALYLLTKTYYVWRNQSRDKKWNAMTDSEKAHYVATTKDEGNKRLDFRFAH